MNLFHVPLYTGLATALLMLGHLILMGLVITQRGKNKVNIGDGGVDSLQQAIRVHGNFLENVPLFLIGLALCEMMAGSTIVVAILGSVFVVARVAHAVGYSMTTGVSAGRLVGTLGSMFTILGVAGYLAYIVFAKL
ncbi:MAG: MAPEG family protein [Pseudomonadales bacterium]|jgi:uncharacterized membrane protein YecN with MAPEG domain|nr:MAPEG family protein [Pseudomonadales bacterium]